MFNEIYMTVYIYTYIVIPLRVTMLHTRVIDYLTNVPVQSIKFMIIDI